jgi:hypothetical protein
VATPTGTHIGTPPLGGATAVGGALRTREVVYPLPLGHIDGPACNVELGVHDGIYYGPPEVAQSNVSGLKVSMRLLDLRATRVLWSAEQAAEGSPRDPLFVREVGEHAIASLPPVR